ncbi:O-acetyltransferase OatA [compost metagenome]
MQFRNDIQILRGLAVAFVVLFHLELAGFSSGFLGVDVFFVISGFLMAVLYKPNHKKEFFAKRAKRLLPSYFVVVFLTLLSSLFFILPSEQGQVIEQSIYSLFFANNIGFWQQNSYFSKSDFNPLLHLWSLGVEIQFYLIVPLLAWFFRKSLAFFILALVGSFLACVFILGVSPKTSFFMMPLRLWEFLIGYGAAYYLTNKGSVKYQNNILGSLSLFLIILIPFLVKIDGNSFSRIMGHPGFFALVICIATAGILVFGLPKILEENLISKALIRLGEYSYSIYLVHFPLIVIYLYQPFSGTILHPESFVEKVVLLILISIFSFVLHNFVEKRKITSIKKIYAISFIGVFVLSSCASVSNSKLYSENDIKIFNGLVDRDSYRCGKLFRLTNSGEIVCKINEGKMSNNVLLLGNSHADSIKNTFKEVAESHNYNTYFFVSNTPMIGKDTPANIVIKEAVKIQADKIILHYKSETIDINNLSELIRLAEKNNINIILIEPVPIYKESIPKTLYNGDKVNYTVKQYMIDNQRLKEHIDSYKKDHTNFYNYEITSSLCNDNECKIVSEDGKPYYFDEDHLTLTGAKKLKPIFEKIFIN